MDEAGGLSVGEQVRDEVRDEVGAEVLQAIRRACSVPLVCPRIGHLHGRESAPKDLA
jgi:hypothetical protein